MKWYFRRSFPFLSTTIWSF